MSHYSLLVITDNGFDHEIVRALAPYHEFECTGIVDQYVQPIDITEEQREYWQKDESSNTFVEYLKEEYAYQTVQPNEEVDIHDKHKWGWIELDSAGDVTKVIKRTNPNDRWDYWEVGGRWSNELLTKSGDKVDSAQYSDIDLDTPKQAAAATAESEWDDFHKLYKDLIPKFQTWDELIKLQYLDSKGAREVYHNQPLCQAIDIQSKQREAPRFHRHLINNYLLPKSEYITKAIHNALPVFAVVKDGHWHSSGEMGWFGISHNLISDWPQQRDTLLSSTLPNQWLSIVDAHK